MKKGLLHRLDWQFLGILSLPILFIVCVKLMTANIHHSICIFKFITGHDCWGCGITRAFNALFNFRFNEAYNYNPRIIIVAPLMLIIWVQTLINYIKIKKNLTTSDFFIDESKEREV